MINRKREEGNTMSDYQGSDIIVPVVEICDGWTVDDVKSLDDCDDAFSYLTGAIVAIEGRISAIHSGMADNDAATLGRLKAALRWKKAAIQIVQNKRGKFAREERRFSSHSYDSKLLKLLLERYPNEFKECVALLKSEEPPSEAAE